MVIKTGRRMSSLDLGNGSSDVSEDLTASDSSDQNPNNRSILDQQQQPSYVIPVDYSFGNTPPIPTHHSQGEMGTNSQNSHG